MPVNKNNILCLCPLTKNIVNLDVFYSDLDDNNHMAISKLKCKSKDACEVAHLDNHGSYFYDNDKCPAIKHSHNY